MKTLETIGVNRAVLALSFARLADGVGNSLLFIVIPLYVAKLPAPLFPFQESVRAGILISFFGIFAGLSQPFTGALIDHVNRRKPFVIAGLLLLAGATVAFALARQFSHALLFRAIQGLGLAITIPATMALLTNTTEKRTRGGSMGTFSTFRVSSLAIGPLIGGYMHDHYGFNATFFTGAAFMLGGVLLVQFWVKEIRVEGQREHPKEFKIIDRRLLSGGMIPLGFATFVMAGSFAMIAPLEEEINSRLNETATTFGIAFSALMVARIIVQIPLGHFSDRKGRKKLIIGGLILTGIATTLMGYVTSTFQLVVLRVFQGIASGAIAGPVFALAGDLSRPGGEGRQMSIVTMGFGFGVALGSLCAGILRTYFFALPFLVVGFLCAIAAWTVHRYARETVGGGIKKEELWE
jgi:MFS family permease